MKKYFKHWLVTAGLAVLAVPVFAGSADVVCSFFELNGWPVSQGVSEKCGKKFQLSVIGQAAAEQYEEIAMLASETAYLDAKKHYEEKKKDVADAQAKLDELKKKLENLEGDEKAALQKEIEEWEKKLETANADLAKADQAMKDAQALKDKYATFTDEDWAKLAEQYKKDYAEQAKSLSEQAEKYKQQQEKYAQDAATDRALQKEQEDLVEYYKGLIEGETDPKKIEEYKKAMEEAQSSADKYADKADYLEYEAKVSGEKASEHSAAAAAAQAQADGMNAANAKTQALAEADAAMANAQANYSSAQAAVAQAEAEKAAAEQKLKDYTGPDPKVVEKLQQEVADAENNLKQQQALLQTAQENMENAYDIWQEELAASGGTGGSSGEATPATPDPDPEVGGGEGSGEGSGEGEGEGYWDCKEHDACKAKCEKEENPEECAKGCPACVWIKK